MPELAVLQPRRDRDAELVSTWLKSKRSDRTRSEYWREVKRFTAWVLVPLERVTLADLLAFRDYLEDELELAPSSRNRAMAGLSYFLPM